MKAFSALSDNILDDPDVQALLEAGEFTKVCLWLLMIPKGTIGGRTGIFLLKQGVRLLSARTCIPVKTITEAFSTFEQLGWIEIDGDYCWIRNRIKWSSNSPNWRGGALSEVRSLTGKTPLALRCLEQYGVETASECRPNGVPTASIPRPIISVSDSISESDQSEHDTAPKKKESKIQAARTALIPLVQECREIIKRAVSIHGMLKEPPNDTDRCAEELEQLIRIDGVPQEDVKRVLIWAMHLKWNPQLGDYESLPGAPQFDWRPVLLSIANWRKISERNNRPKFVNVWTSWTKRDSKVGDHKVVVPVHAAELAKAEDFANGEV